MRPHVCQDNAHSSSDSDGEDELSDGGAAKKTHGCQSETGSMLNLSSRALYRKSTHRRKRVKLDTEDGNKGVLKEISAVGLTTGLFSQSIKHLI